MTPGTDASAARPAMTAIGRRSEGRDPRHHAARMMIGGTAKTIETRLRRPRASARGDSTWGAAYSSHARANRPGRPHCPPGVAATRRCLRGPAHRRGRRQGPHPFEDAYRTAPPFAPRGYAVGHPGLAAEGRWMAAVLAIG